MFKQWGIGTYAGIIAAVITGMLTGIFFPDLNFVFGLALAMFSGSIFATIGSAIDDYRRKQKTKYDDIDDFV